MTKALINSNELRIDAIDETCMLLRRALDRLDAVDAGTVAAPEIDQALHNLKHERERLRAASER